MDFECQCLYIVAKQFLDVVLLLATGILPEKEPVHFHFMHTVKAAEPESIRHPAQRAPAPNRPRLEDLAFINSKKWDKGVSIS